MCIHQQKEFYLFSMSNSVQARKLGGRINPQFEYITNDESPLLDVVGVYRIEEGNESLGLQVHDESRFVVQLNLQTKSIIQANIVQNNQSFPVTFNIEAETERKKQIRFDCPAIDTFWAQVSFRFNTDIGDDETIIANYQNLSCQ